MNLTVEDLMTLIGNPDTLAVQREDGSWAPVKDLDIEYDLDLHLLGKQSLGTYVNRGDKARVLLFDVDVNDPAPVKAIGKALRSVGVPANCIGVASSGNKGHHIFVRTGGYVLAKDLRRLGRAVMAIAQVDGPVVLMQRNSSITRVDLFPMQDSVPEGGLGNLFALPGGINRKSGKRREMLSPFPEALSWVQWNDVVSALPEGPATVGGGGRPDSFPCLTKIQEGISAGGRNTGLFHFAACMRRAGLSEANLVEALEQTNLGCNPPLQTKELLAILNSSKNSGPICGQLPAELHCGSLCILTRGLKIRPGTIKTSSPGDAVVVEVGERRGQVIDLAHPDLSQGRGIEA